MTDSKRPWGLTPADLAPMPHPDWLDRRYQFVIGYCEGKGWPQDPARLTYEQLAEVIVAWEACEARGGGQ